MNPMIKLSSVAVKQGMPFSAENADVEGLVKPGE